MSASRECFVTLHIFEQKYADFDWVSVFKIALLIWFATMVIVVVVVKAPSVVK